MTRSSSHNLSSAERPLALRARGDLEHVSVTYSGQAAYVVRDPLTLELFHLTAEEHFLLQSLQQPVSLSQLRRDFQQRFAPRCVSHEALQQGVNQLHLQGLLLSEASAQGDELFCRGRRRARGERMQSLLRLLSYRLGSIDATRLVDGLHARVRWIFSPVCLAVLFAAMFYALWLLLGHGSEMIAQLPSIDELARPRVWLLWITTIVVVKVVHELAHAVTCRHMGGRCHEIGVLLLAGVPCLYCDVSDVWRLPNKWQRIAVSAAGVIVEFAIALVALIVWWHTPSGLLHTWALSLVVVCSVGTLLINANPLLRYDGYYVLSDLVEVPNLAGRARGLLPGAVRNWLLGQSQTTDELLSARQRCGLILYALLATAYLTTVLLSIFVVLLAWARPYRLENLVYTLGVVAMIGMVAGPLTAFWRMASNPAVRYRVRRARAGLLAAAISAMVIAVLYWPVSHSVRGSVVLVPAHGQVVYATVAGELRQGIAPGTIVAKGEIVAKLIDPSIESNLAKQTGEYEVRRVHVEQLRTMRAWDHAASSRLPTARAALVDAEAQLSEYDRHAEELTITAPIAGTIIAPPEQSTSTDDRLPTWTGSPLDERNLGCWIEPGTVLCSIGDPRRLAALVAVDQADIPEVCVGQRVRIVLDAAPGRVLEGEVTQVARRAAQRLATNSAIDPGKYHLVEVRLDVQDSRQLVGARGSAKITATSRTLGEIAAAQLRRMLRLPW